MQYLQAKAATTPTTDRGELRALVATWDRDREGDRIVRGAFGNSIDEWVEVGRAVPLHWNHRSDEIIGEVDPSSMTELSDGLEVEGRIDLDDGRGRMAWKGLKANRLAFSFGFLATKTREADDGTRELVQIDIFEVSIKPSQANNRTRLLSTKSMSDRYALPDGRVVDYETMVVEGPKLAAQRAKAHKSARPIQIATFRC
jgi:HK97 family phage prohead protease